MNDDFVFESNDGTKFELIEPHSPELKTKIEAGYLKGKLLVWKKSFQDGFRNDLFSTLDVKDVDIEVLKKLDIWGSLPEEIKKDLEGRSDFEKQQVIEHMGKMRMGRRKKYENVPKELTCVQCKCTVEVTPSVLAKKVEKLGILLDDYIKDFHCKRCRPPVKGRKANPALAHLPTELVCVCGNKISVTPSYIAQRAKVKNVTPEEIVKGYVCQKCNPTKGRGRKKKA